MPPVSADNGSPPDSATLAAIEERVLTQVGARLSDITNHFGAYLASVLRDGPVITGHELVSRDDIYNTLKTVLDGAQARIEAQIRAGYRASAASARAGTEKTLPGFTSPPPPAEDPPYLAAIVAALVIAFAVALSDILASIQSAFDGVKGTAAAVVAARILATHTAVDRAVRRLGVRARSAVSVAVNRGYTDAQAVVIDAYMTAHPSVPMRKQWVATAADPCPSCRALNGTILPVDAEFDPYVAASDKWRPPKVWRDLQGPPRHPNCRCRLLYLPSDGGQVQQITSADPPAGTPTRLSAADVRNMPAQRFNALVSYFKAAARKLISLIRNRKSGNTGA